MIAKEAFSLSSYAPLACTHDVKKKRKRGRREKAKARQEGRKEKNSLNPHE
jgi:hypothetical protein